MFNDFYPVLFDEDILHYDVRIKGMNPTSAGLFLKEGTTPWNSSKSKWTQ